MLHELTEQLHEAVRAFVEDDGPRFINKVFYPRSPPLFLGEEALEHEPVGWKPARYERRDEGSRAGEDFNPNARSQCFPNQQEPRIGDARCACIRDERDGVARLQAFHQPLRLPVFVVDVEARTRRIDVVIVQEDTARPRVLAGNQVHLPEYAKSAQRGILQIADGSGDKVEHVGNDEG